MDKSLHLIKLCVGAETVQDLLDWQKNPRAKGPDGRPRHVTRMWPKRECELLDDGALFWVCKGIVLCRQRIVRLDEVIREDGIRRCGIVLDPEPVRVEAMPKRPFQGWRYLVEADSPPDLQAGETALPADLQNELADLGLL